MTDHVIFDLDGTLIDSMPIWENLGSSLLRLYGVVPSEAVASEVRSLSLLDAMELFRIHFPELPAPEELIEKLSLLIHDSYAYDVPLKPGVKDYLEKLARKGVLMCIATASPAANVRVALKRMDILHHFEFILTEGEFGSGKENPGIFIECARRFGAAPSDVTVFEDALHAALSAKAAGFNVIGVYDLSSAEVETLMKETCDRYIRNFNELEDMS